MTGDAINTDDEIKMYDALMNPNVDDKDDKVVDTTGESDLYDDKQDGLDDDLYDEELEVPSEEDLPISNAKVSIVELSVNIYTEVSSWRLKTLAHHSQSPLD